jgi:hypothetical protein
VTPRDPSPEHAEPPRGDCDEDAAAYALGALEPDQAERFRLHLLDCVVCRDEVASLQVVTDALGLAVPQLSAPRGLRRKVLSGVRAEARQHRLAPRTGAWRRLPSPLARPSLASAVALTAMLALVAVALVASLRSSGGSSATRVVQASVSNSTGSAAVQIASGSAELIVRHMPPPPPGEIYEVWLGHPRGAPSPTSALFDVTSRGSATVEVPGDLHGVDEVLVTPERLGGSAVPTHAPVIVARLARE